MPGDNLPANLTVVDHPLVRVKLTRLRNRDTEPAIFRQTLCEIAALLLFEATRSLETHPSIVESPLATCAGSQLARPLIIAPILRAGLGLMDGMLSLLRDVSVGHIGMFRDEQTLLPQAYYFNFPEHLAESDVLVVDPMLATGSSAVAAIDRLKLQGATRIRFACVVGCPEGVHQMAGAHPDVPMFTAAIDPGLNERGYIVPGLGDAGDRYFGTEPRSSDSPGRVEAAKRS